MFPSRIPRAVRNVSVVVAMATVTSLVGCSAMPATRSGFLTEPAKLAFNEDGSVGRYRGDAPIDVARSAVGEIRWEASESITAEERETLTRSLRQALTVATSEARSPGPGRPVLLRAAITRVETVSPAVNAVWALLLLPPLDRGGAAVELEAVDAETGRPLAAMSHAYFAPLSEFRARFYRLAPAEVAFRRASQEFVALLGAESPKGK
jgi:hypothetical protein